MLESGGKLPHRLSLPPFLISRRALFVFVEHPHEVDLLMKKQGAHALLRAGVRVACKAGNDVRVPGSMEREGERLRGMPERSAAAAGTAAMGRARTAAHDRAAGLDMLCVEGVCRGFAVVR